MTKDYRLFLFDLDDTLLDFKESEKLSFSLALQSLGLKHNLDSLFTQYQKENRQLWTLFEKGEVAKEFLKVERFQRIFRTHGIDIDPKMASGRYLEALPETVVLMDHAIELCDELSKRGDIGIITNGIHHVQMQRIENSKLTPYIQFICVSEECGFAKPDVRFFEYTAKVAPGFSKENSLVIGDRLETDIQGAHNFGIDSCWFNPEKFDNQTNLQPHYQIQHLSELVPIVRR